MLDARKIVDRDKNSVHEDVCTVQDAPNRMADAFYLVKAVRKLISDVAS